ncbi:hypothetical protein ZTR_03511 [Talaromyces verruculosus]|nr:hypothetical protein ZTR_03511 [Talaromyces verruculosus]
MQTMPPRTSLTSSFSVSDANNEVEKRYRSMQEHIRRAHPNHYIPKLPATEESFLLMVNTPLDQRAHLNTQPTPSPAKKYDTSPPVTPRTIDDAHPAAATAAVALAQLHHHRLASDWDEMDTHSDNELGRGGMHSSIELPPLRDHFKQEPLPPFQSSRPRELLPSILSHSPPGRSSTLPPLQRNNSKIQRPRKSSITQNVRKPKHDRTRSKEFARRPSLGDRKALSAEPQTAAWVQGKRWEDLIEAATSATEVDEDRDTTPVPHSPSMSTLLNNTTSISSAKNRNSLPPSLQPSSLAPIRRSFQGSSYTESPLQKSLTPPPLELHRSRDSDMEPFPSIEPSLESASTVSGKNFHMSASGLPSSVNSDSSPLNHLHNHVRPQHRFSNPTPSTFRHRDIQIYSLSRRRPATRVHGDVQSVAQSEGNGKLFNWSFGDPQNFSITTQNILSE